MCILYTKFQYSSLKLCAAIAFMYRLRQQKRKSLFPEVMTHFMKREDMSEKKEVEVFDDY